MCTLFCLDGTDDNESVQKNMSVPDVFSGTNEWILDIELVKYLHNYDMIYNLDYIKYSILRGDSC